MLLKFKMTGKTISEAIAIGINVLKLPPNDYEINVIKQAQNFQEAEIEFLLSEEVVRRNPQLKKLKLYPIMPTRPAKLMEEVMASLTHAEATVLEFDDPIDLVRDFLEKFFNALKLDNFEMKIYEEEKEIKVDTFGANLKQLIGPNGRVIGAIQLLMNACVRQQFPTLKRVALDINGFKIKQKAQLEEIAAKAVKAVRKTGEPVVLRPMNSFERLIVHAEIAKFEDMKTSSDGDEPKRFIIVSKK